MADVAAPAVNVAFTKMHGLGNDFVVIDAESGGFGGELNVQQRRCIGDRRRGVGCDQILVITRLPSERPTSCPRYRMVIYNADGTEAEACGNGTRCVAAWILTRPLHRHHTTCNVVTLGGTIHCTLLSAVDGCIGTHTVSIVMPPPAFLPALTEADRAALGVPSPDGGAFLDCVAVNMGNPHLVVLMPPGLDNGQHHVETFGARWSKPTPLFPQGANVEFVSSLPPGCEMAADGLSVRVRVFERGAGITEACGSGTCAAVVAALRCGWCGLPKLGDGGDMTAVTAVVDGGSMQVAWAGAGDVELVGPATFVFEGCHALLGDRLGCAQIPPLT